MTTKSTISRLLNRKVFGCLFTEFNTYKGDPLWWMADWGTICYRGPVPRFISVVVFYTYVVTLYAMTTYVLVMRPQEMIFRNCVALSGCLIYLLTTYGTIMRNYEKLLKAMQEIEKLHNTFTRPPSESLLKNITISSLRFRKFSAIFTVITFLQSMSTFMLFEDRATSFPYILIKNIFGDNIIIKIALCSVILPHSWCFGSMPMLLSNYYTWHFEYSLKMLKEQMEMCTINKTGHVHTLDPLDCSICQRMIENELKYFLKQYTRINSAIVFYIDIVKWRFLAIACAGAYFMATTSFYIMSLRSKAAFPYLGLLLISTLVAFVFSEGGEKIEEECRQIHIAAQQFKWYYWNKSNRQLLLMFLTMTEHPMSVTCYGFATQNRTLLLKVCRMIHAYITYIQSSATN